MFGIPPQVRLVDESREGPSAHWVARVISIAADRMRSHVQRMRGQPIVRQAFEAVLDLDQHSMQTKGRYLEEGWRDWRKTMTRSGTGIPANSSNSSASTG